MNSNDVKQKLYDMGAALAGIAPVDRFGDAPEGYHPTDVLPNCKSVVVFAVPFCVGTLKAASSAPYTVMRNMLSDKLSKMSAELCMYMESEGFASAPLHAIGCETDERTGRSRAPVSFKHAAQAAGLGVIGRHSLLITPDYGSMVWLGLALTEAELEPDPLLTMSPCDGCAQPCVRACPINAVESVEINQNACWNYAFGEVKGDWRISCHACRDACPHNIKAKNKGLMK